MSFIGLFIQVSFYLFLLMSYSIVGPSLIRALIISSDVNVSGMLKKNYALSVKKCVNNLHVRKKCVYLHIYTNKTTQRK